MIQKQTLPVRALASATVCVLQDRSLGAVGEGGEEDPGQRSKEYEQEGDAFRGNVIDGDPSI